MRFYVRPVLSGDWEQLRDLRLKALATDPAAFGATYAQVQTITDAEWREQADASEQGLTGRWFVAVECSGGWVGIAFTQGAEGPEARLFGMWVAPAARGAGVAAALCDACCRWATEHGFASIVLGVFAGNERAITAYHRAGFTEYGGISEQSAQRVVDVILMRREIRAEPGADSQLQHGD